MADNTTGLPVQTLSGQFVQTKLVDSGGSNVAAVSAAGRLSVDASGVTVPVSIAAAIDTELPTAAALADAASATPTTPTVGAVGLVMNATTLDRQRAVVNGMDSTGTGIAAAGLVGQLDDSTTGTVTENQFAPVRISSRRALLVEGVASGTNQNVNIAASGVTLTVDTELPAAAALADATSNPTVPATGAFLMGYNGTTWDRVRTANTGRLQVDVVSGGSSGTQYAGDAAATSTPTGTMSMGLANASAPADVSANNDAVAQWMLRNGSAVMNLASVGTLITIGQKTMANSLPVTLASDQTALASNITQIGGATQSQTNPLFVRLTDGTSAYSAGSSAPTAPVFSTQTSSALGAGSNVRLNHYVTSGKTGQLMGVDAGSTVPCKIEIQTILTCTPTTRVVLFTKPYEVYQWRSPFKTFITRASADATTGFSVTITNKDASVAADVYSTAFWDEV